MVDDFIPCRNGRPCFTRAKGNELWVILLEKAWAKVHGAYQRINGGYPLNALRDLTGAPSFTLFAEDDPEIPDKLVEANKNNWIMAASCFLEGHSGESKSEEIGLVSGHAYSLIDARKIDYNGETITLCKIRNPWGGTEWKGDWSDNSEKWDEISEELKFLLGFTVEDDGTFWMEYNDMKPYFDSIDVCKVNDDYLYEFHRCKHKEDGYSLV